jgi:hypothetical protein
MIEKTEGNEGIRTGICFINRKIIIITEYAVSDCGRRATPTVHSTTQTVEIISGIARKSAVSDSGRSVHTKYAAAIPAFYGIVNYQTVLNQYRSAITIDSATVVIGDVAANCTIDNRWQRANVTIDTSAIPIGCVFCDCAVGNYRPAID